MRRAPFIGKSVLCVCFMALMASPSVAQTAGTVAAQPGSQIAQLAPVARDPGYALGTGDKVRITVFGEEGMTGDYAVTPGGAISFPLIGEIPAQGRTLADVALEIRQRLLAGYINDPRVAIDLLEYRSFFILGEVNKPGAYPYTAGLTLGRAVATAGGYTYRARKSKVVVRHDGSTQDERVSVEDSGLVVRPGDTIVVPERFF
ncbi:polysaccharide export protein [Novosphingobium sp. Rr 2-17]|nr:polysaccharide export protein [Novosphingobium sp. Rr 2-17]